MSFKVPQIPFRFPGDEKTSWVDLNEHLNNNGILFLCEELNTDISNNLIGLMLYLGMENNTQELFLFINSTGGEIINGIAMHNVMEFIPPAVNTICLGIAASTASYVLVGGEYKKRVALPHARIMIHQPLSTYYLTEDDRAGRVYFELEELLAMRETVARVYSERTGKPLRIISQDLERDFFMSATEAEAYGIVDRIQGNSKKQNI